MNDLSICTTLPRWVKASKYSAISGYSLPALRKKRQNAVWLEGIHWRRAPDGNVYYDWQRIDQWVENGI